MSLQKGKSNNIPLPACSVIVLNFNGIEFLRSFLRSVERIEYKNYEVIVVDNGSTDGSVEFLKKNFRFRIIVNSKNLGTAEGYNVGMRNAEGENFLLLSNDMEVDPSILSELIAVIQSDPSIGICGCKMVALDENNQRTKIIDNVCGEADVYGFPYVRGHRQLDQGQLDEVEEVFFAFGGGMFIKSEVFQRTGGYDPAYFTLQDDLDLCWRAWLMGYRVVGNPKAVIYHKVSATLGPLFSRRQKRFWSERNTLRTILKNYSGPTLVKIIPRYLGLIFSEVFFFLLLHRLDLALADICALIWNIRNLKNTWKLHRAVQSSRCVNDESIQKKLIRTPLKLLLYKSLGRNL